MKLPPFRFSDIRGQLLDQLKCLDDRKEQQTAIIGELQEYFRRRADVENEYSKSLDRLAKNLSQKQKAEKQRLANRRCVHSIQQDRVLCPCLGVMLQELVNTVVVSDVNSGSSARPTLCTKC